MKKLAFVSLAKASFSRLTLLGAVLAAFVCLATTARADSTSGAFYYQDLGSYTSLDLASAPTTTS